MAFGRTGYRRFRRTWLCLTVLSAAALAGCGHGDRPKLGQVHGRVTLDKKPLARVMVIFHPAVGAREATGVTTETGDYVLKYIRDEMGAAVGKNKVRVTKQRNNDPASETVPKKYNQNTTLACEVKPGDNEINFDLTTK